MPRGWAARPADEPHAPRASRASRRPEHHRPSPHDPHPHAKPRTGKGAPEFDATCKDQATEIGQVVVVGTAYGTHLVRVNGRGERDG